MTNKKEAVNHPSHYNHGKYEVIDIIHDQINPMPITHGEAWDLGTALKYLLRFPYKGTAIQDLDKALNLVISVRNSLAKEQEVPLIEAKPRVIEAKNNEEDTKDNEEDEEDFLESISDVLSAIVKGIDEEEEEDEDDPDENSEDDEDLLGLNFLTETDQDNLEDLVRAVNKTLIKLPRGEKHAISNIIFGSTMFTFNEALIKKVYALGYTKENIMKQIMSLVTSYLDDIELETNKPLTDQDKANIKDIYNSLVNSLFEEAFKQINAIINAE